MGARTLLVAGTASHVGKSTVVAGLCRRLADRGVSVAPYKAQNMSNNARVALDSEGEWGEIGVSQHVQARAARVTPTVDHNPVLLKPRGDGESQLVLQGQAVGHYGARRYYEEHWSRAREAARESYRRLADRHSVVIAEGAGSIAEINLHDRDLANVETARFADAAILLVVDIERGGAFASAYGTLELMPADLRERVAGILITKFRGDRSLLAPGIADLEERTGLPVVGVLDHDDPGLPAEDSVSLPDGVATVGDGDPVPDSEAVTVAVPRLGHVSNFTDLAPLADQPGVRVVYRPPDAGLGAPDAVVVPGTKNTVDDLLALRAAGMTDELAAFDGPVVGICGGYQLLGGRITNAAIESTGDADTVEGVGRLPVETRFSAEKRVERVTRPVDGAGPIRGAGGTASGYEIHMGRSTPASGVARPLGGQSAALGSTLGTYLHGLFENAGVRDAFLDRVFASAGRERPSGVDDDRPPHDRAADLVADLDIDALLPE